MKLLRRKTLKPVSLVLALFMLTISGPFQSAHAALIGTEAVLDSARGQQARAYLKQLLALSMITEHPLPPEKLLNLYRLGDQSSPWEELSEDKLRRVEDILRQRVIGQDEAIRHAATMMKRAYLGLSGLQHSGRKTKPKGVMYFVGPTGVGKTELAKAIAEFLFGDETAFIRFDMSEYNHEHSDQKLIGAPPGYVGFEQGGQLTNAVRKKPFSVILFDEIEKAHGRILDKFLITYQTSLVVCQNLLERYNIYLRAKQSHKCPDLSPVSSWDISHLIYNTPRQKDSLVKP